MEYYEFLSLFRGVSLGCAMQVPPASSAAQWRASAPSTNRRALTNNLNGSFSDAEHMDAHESRLQSIDGSPRFHDNRPEGRTVPRNRITNHSPEATHAFPACGRTYRPARSDLGFQCFGGSTGSLPRLLRLQVAREHQDRWPGTTVRSRGRDISRLNSPRGWHDEGCAHWLLAGVAFPYQRIE